MGHEAKRVALEFSWPLNRIWKGYLNPYVSQPCNACSRTGYNPATKALADAWYSSGSERWVYLSPVRRYNDLAWSHHLDADDVKALVDNGCLYHFTHTWNGVSKRWDKKDPACIPTPDEVNAWSLDGLGHDTINKAKAERLGIYGHCSVCGGDGEVYLSPEIKARAKSWQPEEPPAGDGFQMWETTSEGSPISPVFASAEELARWLADFKVSSFGSESATYEQWLPICKGGWAPDLVSDAHGLRSGIKAGMTT